MPDWVLPQQPEGSAIDDWSLENESFGFNTPGRYTDVDSYNAALERFKQRQIELLQQYQRDQNPLGLATGLHGLAGNGEVPTLSRGGQLQQALRAQGYDQQTPGSDPFQRMAGNFTSLPITSSSPFYTANADQSRESQLALLQQMQRNAQGPSLAGMQGQQALGRLGATAAGQAAMGNSRAALLGARSASAGMGFDTAQARLQEALRARAGVGGAAGGIRGADIRTQDTAARMGLQSMQNQLSNRLAFAGLGARQANIQDQARLELFKAMQRADLNKRAKDQQTVKQGVGTAATVVGAFGS